MNEDPHRFRKDIGIGIGLTLLFHIVTWSIAALLMGLLGRFSERRFLAGLPPLLAVVAGVAYIIGGVQWARREGRKGFIVGLILAYAIPLLLVAACFGLAFLAFSSYRA